MVLDEQTYRKKQLNYALWLNWISVSAVAAVIWYACISQGQLHEMHRETVVDQRPWLEATNAQDSEKTPLADISELSFPMKIMNHGKTPAISTRVDTVVEIVKSYNAPTFDYSPDHTFVTFGVLFPDGHFDFPANRINPDRSPKTLTTIEREELTNNKSYLAAYGKITYVDSFGISHWTQFCWWRSFSTVGYTNASTCTSYNNVDNNPPQ